MAQFQHVIDQMVLRIIRYDRGHQTTESRFRDSDRLKPVTTSPSCAMATSVPCKMYKCILVEDEPRCSIYEGSGLMRVIARDVRSYWAAGALRKPSPSLGCGIYVPDVAPRTRALLLKRIYVRHPWIMRASSTVSRRHVREPPERAHPTRAKP